MRCSNRGTGGPEGGISELTATYIRITTWAKDHIKDPAWASYGNGSIYSTVLISWISKITTRSGYIDDRLTVITVGSKTIVNNVIARYSKADGTCCRNSHAI